MSTIEVGLVWLEREKITDGICVRHSFYNAGEKRIKYLIFSYLPFNQVGDVVACTISKKSEVNAKITGPIEAKRKQNVGWEHLWYNSTVSKVLITKIHIQYMDGTEELIDCKDIISMDDPKSTYYHEVGRLEIDGENITNYSDFCDRYVSKYKDEDEKVVLALIKHVKISSVKGYRIGDAFEKYFSDNKNVMKQVASFWKQSIEFQQTNFAHPDAKDCKGFPEKYAKKVKKYEPAYVMPKKAGCISFGK